MAEENSRRLTRAQVQQESPIKKTNAPLQKKESASKSPSRPPMKESVSSKQHTSQSPPEIVRRSKRQTKTPVNYDEEKIITYEYIPVRPKNKVSKNPLLSGSSKAAEPKSEFVRKGKDLVDQKDAPKHAGSDDEGEIERELQKEKEKKVVIHTDKELEDMKLLFNMPEEEISRIKNEQDAFLKQKQEEELFKQHQIQIAAERVKRE